MNMTVSNQQAENEALLDALPKKVLPAKVNTQTPGKAHVTVQG